MMRSDKLDDIAADLEDYFIESERLRVSETRKTEQRLGILYLICLVVGIILLVIL